MSIKTHYSIAQAGETDQAFEVGSISPANSAGPSCKHFFSCNEGSGTTLTDIIGGANLATATNAWGTGPNGGEYHDGADIDEATAAAFNDFTTNDFAFFFVADRGDQGFAAAVKMGKTNDVGGAGGSVVGGGEFGASIDDGATAVDFTNVALPDDGDTETTEISFGVVRSGNTCALWISIDGVVTTEAKDCTGLDYQPDQFMTNSTWLYGMAAWEFPDGLPTDYAEQFAWMSTQWRAGNKLLPAEWVIL